MKKTSFVYQNFLQIFLFRYLTPLIIASLFFIIFDFLVDKLELSIILNADRIPIGYIVT